MTDVRNQFDALHRDHHAMVLQMCRGFLKGDRDQAADLAQDVFINVWNALPNFRGDASPKTWIYRITVNTCLQFLRKSARRSKVPLEQVAGIASESRTEDEPSDKLMRAIGQLEDVDRLIIMMVLEEIEYVEIARVMGITENNLRVKVYRIKTRIKEYMSYGK